MSKNIENQVWELDEFGLKNLTLRRKPIASPQENEVLVEVFAASINFRDLLVVEGELLPYQPEMPFVPLSDMSGRIVEVGKGVTDFAVGDRVISHFRTTWLDEGVLPADGGFDRTLGAPLQGVLARYCVLPKTGVVHAPETLTHTEACTLPIAGLTAWSALREIGEVVPDSWVVVQGTGGVSLAALKIAKAFGAHVAVTSRSEEKFQAAYKEGADLVIDTSHEKHWSDEFLRHTRGIPASQVLEVLGGSNVKESMAVLGHGGRIHSIGFLESRFAEIDLIPLNVKKISIHGISVGHRKSLQRFVEAVDTMKINPVISAVFSFEEALMAFGMMRQGVFGNVVIEMKKDA